MTVSVGTKDGAMVPFTVGRRVGFNEGDTVGTLVGFKLGPLEGIGLGLTVGTVGRNDTEGTITVGLKDRWVGVIVGRLVEG